MVYIGATDCKESMINSVYGEVGDWLWLYGTMNGLGYPAAQHYGLILGANGWCMCNSPTQIESTPVVGLFIMTSSPYHELSTFIPPSTLHFTTLFIT
jgi:hypothetical protein